MTMSDLSAFKDFPINSVVQFLAAGETNEITYGVVVGYSLNSFNEILLKLSVITREKSEVVRLIHPYSPVLNVQVVS